MIFDLTLESDILSSSIVWVEKEGSSNARMMTEKLSAEDFYNTNNKNIFLLIKKCLEQDLPPTYMNIENIGASEKMKGSLAELEIHRSFETLKPFLKRLKIISKARKLAMQSSILIKYFKDNLEDIETAYSEKEAEIASILNERISSDQGYFIKDELKWWFEKLEESCNSKKQPGIPTGIKMFDEITGGLRPSESVLISGRPGMGKSSLALSIIAHLIMYGYKPAYFSLELSKTEIYNKLYSILSEMVLKTEFEQRNRIIPYKWLRNPKRNIGMLNRLSEITPILHNCMMYFNCDPYQDMNEIKSICRELKHDDGLDIAIIDHLGRMVKDRRTEYQELTQMSSDCKNLAIELDIVSMPLVQLKRDAEKAGEPSLSHLKGTGAFEEDADIVLFPWRPFVIDKDKYSPDEAILITGKARNDIIPNINMRFSTQTTLFEYIKIAKEEKEEF